MRIGNLFVDRTSKPFVIAELGHNHQGDLETCLKMIRAAAQAGASAVKLQKRSNVDLFTPAAFNAPYLSENAFGDTYGSHRSFLEFGEDQYRACIEEAKSNNIIFFATAFDFPSADFLENLGVPAFKIASGDLKSLPLIDHIAKFKKPIIISTGGGTLEDIDQAVKVIENYHSDYAILQCTAAYPPTYEELNLKVIQTYLDRYPNAVIGYSGHDSGISMSLVAYVLGARVIEKHFTLNRAMKGTDHAFSLEPTGMRKLVRDLERAEIAFGDGIKRVYESEQIPLQKMGKSLYFAHSMTKGTALKSSDIEMRSPSAGIEPGKISEILGRILVRDVKEFESINMSHFE
jgi:N-acetylneuraminate synthase/sialic acid synthase